jgi:hypothetical protein
VYWFSHIWCRHWQLDFAMHWNIFFLFLLLSINHHLEKLKLTLYLSWKNKVISIQFFSFREYTQNFFFNLWSLVGGSTDRNIWEKTPKSVRAHDVISMMMKSKFRTNRYFFSICQSSVRDLNGWTRSIFRAKKCVYFTFIASHTRKNFISISKKHSHNRTRLSRGWKKNMPIARKNFQLTKFTLKPTISLSIT